MSTSENIRNAIPANAANLLWKSNLNELDHNITFSYACKESFFAISSRSSSLTGAGSQVLERYITEDLADSSAATIRNVRYIMRCFLWHLAQSDLGLQAGKLNSFGPLWAMHRGRSVFNMAPGELHALRLAYKPVLVAYLAELGSRQTRMACYQGQQNPPPTVSWATLTRYLSVIKRFFDYVEDRYGLPSPARHIQAPKAPVAIRRRKRNQRLSDDQVRQLLDVVDSYPLTTADLRNRAIIYLLLYTGRRTAELARANVEDVTVEGGHRVLYYQGKGQAEKGQFTVLHPDAARALDDYLALRGVQLNGVPLLVSESDRSRGKRLTTRSFSYAVKHALKAIGLGEANVYTAHGLRRTFTSHLCDLGVPDHDIADARGDANLAMIRVYRQTQKRLKDPAELRVCYRPKNSSCQD